MNRSVVNRTSSIQNIILQIKLECRDNADDTRKYQYTQLLPEVIDKVYKIVF
jgi:hypothetical protein